MEGKLSEVTPSFPPRSLGNLSLVGETEPHTEDDLAGCLTPHGSGKASQAK